MLKSYAWRPTKKRGIEPTAMSSLRYGYYWPDTTALGPGHRFVLWMQGCRRRCFRCASPELMPLDKGQSMSVAEMANLVCADPATEGLTISGGEPLLQCTAVTDLIETVREKRPALNVILFTGYLLEDLKSDEAQRLLRGVDLLIDGEYEDDLNDDKGLRGSSNQRLHFLTDRLIPWREQLLHGARRREIHMMGQHETITIGIAPRRTSNGIK